MRACFPSRVNTLSRWAEAGCPEGDPSEAPAQRTGLSCTLGTHDLVLKVHDAYQARFRAAMSGRVLRVPTRLTEGTMGSRRRLPGPATRRWAITSSARFDVRGARTARSQTTAGLQTVSGSASFPGRLGLVAGQASPGLALSVVGRTCRPLRRLDPGVITTTQAISDASASIYFAKVPSTSRFAGDDHARPAGLLVAPLAIPGRAIRATRWPAARYSTDSHPLVREPRHALARQGLLLAANAARRLEGDLIPESTTGTSTCQGAYDFVTPVALPSTKI